MLVSGEVLVDVDRSAEAMRIKRRLARINGLVTDLVIRNEAKITRAPYSENFDVEEAARWEVGRNGWDPERPPRSEIETLRGETA